MSKEYTKADLVNFILEEDLDDTSEDEELIHMLLKRSIAKNANRPNKELSLGARLADSLARVAGSWTFILLFCGALLAWIILNSILLFSPYDPYPFILLNLVLSCVAAVQAPIIMMSQNRQDEKDRIRAENDYKVNLKSELIVEDLHEKLDRLIRNQEQILANLDSLHPPKGDPDRKEKQA